MKLLHIRFDVPWRMEAVLGFFSYMPILGRMRGCAVNACLMAVGET